MEPACNDLLFSFKATENLSISKEINSHNKTIPTDSQGVRQVPRGEYAVSHSIPRVYFVSPQG